MDVRLENLRKVYPTPAEPLVVLDRIDLALESGAALAITGPSGSGKSTLLHIMGTLDTPTEGSVRLGGEYPFGLDEEALSRFRNAHVGFVFQDHYLLPQLTVLENVIVPTLVGEREREDGPSSEERARELLGEVGLSARLDHRPAELSGGEKQRVAIARALIRNPGLVLCDEPTGNLDVENARRIGDLLLELHERARSTLIAVTHSLELAGRFPRRATIRAGRLTEGNGGA